MRQCCAAIAAAAAHTLQQHRRGTLPGRGDTAPILRKAYGITVATTTAGASDGIGINQPGCFGVATVTAAAANTLCEHTGGKVSTGNDAATGLVDKNRSANSTAAAAATDGDIQALGIAAIAATTANALRQDANSAIVLGTDTAAGHVHRGGAAIATGAAGISDEGRRAVAA